MATPLHVVKDEETKVKPAAAPAKAVPAPPPPPPVHPPSSPVVKPAAPIAAAKAESNNQDPTKGILKTDALPGYLDDFVNKTVPQIYEEIKDEMTTELNTKTLANEIAVGLSKIWSSFLAGPGAKVEEYKSRLTGLLLFTEPETVINNAKETISGVDGNSGAVAKFKLAVKEAYEKLLTAEAKALEAIDEAKRDLGEAELKLSAQLARLGGQDPRESDSFSKVNPVLKAIILTVIVFLPSGFEWLMGYTQLEQASDPMTAIALSILFAVGLTITSFAYGDLKGKVEAADEINSGGLPNGVEKIQVTKKTRTLLRVSGILWIVIAVVLVISRLIAMIYNNADLFTTIASTSGVILFSVLAGFGKYYLSPRFEKTEIAKYDRTLKEVELAKQKLTNAENLAVTTKDQLVVDIDQAKQQFMKETDIAIDTTVAEQARKDYIESVIHLNKIFGWLSNVYTKAVGIAMERLITEKPELEAEIWDIKGENFHLKKEVNNLLATEFDSHLKLSIDKPIFEKAKSTNFQAIVSEGMKDSKPDLQKLAEEVLTQIRAEAKKLAKRRAASNLESVTAYKW